jgi:hypothetical protein
MQGPLRYGNVSGGSRIRVEEGRAVALWLSPASVLCAFGLLLALTASADPGDTRDYAKSIVERFSGRDLFFWEPGHLFWRPLGYLLVLITQPSRDGMSAATLYADTVHALTAISVVMGAVTLLAFLAWEQRMGVPCIPAVAAAIAMSTSCAFLNYAETGASYLPALAMLTVALWTLAVTDDSRSPCVAVVPSLALAASVLLWLPMVLVAPIAAASQLILRGNSTGRWRTAAAVSVMSGILVIAAYLFVASVIGIRSPSEFHAWMSGAAHGIENGGVKRAAIGLGRSVVSMEQLGIVAKRHLLGDRYNPATMGDVARAGVYRLVLFYGVLGVMILALVRRPTGRRTVAILALTALPVLAFAIAWQGGDLERYFAFFPALFLALGTALATLPPRSRGVSAAALVLIMGALNLRDYSRSDATRRCTELARRIRSVPTAVGKPTLMVTPLNSDGLTTLRGRCPESPVLAAPVFPSVLGLVTPHVSDAPEWRRVFAGYALDTWRDGGRVWLSVRALAPKPAAEWNWAEGDDPRVHWRDFPSFFASLDRSDTGHGSDAFVEILRTAKNAAVLDSVRSSPLVLVAQPQALCAMVARGELTRRRGSC